LFTGDALLRAYEIGETQQLIGITVCNVIRQRFLKNPFSFNSGSPVIKDYLIPVKGGHQNSAVLNWPALCVRELQLITPLSESSLANYFSTFGKYESLDESAKTKYSNTVEFIKNMG
jgi:hypothetical protein